MDRRIIILGNGLEWCEKSLADFRDVPNTKIINKRMPCRSKMAEKLLKVHFSNQINKKIKLPLKCIWYSYFAKCMSKDRKTPLLIVVYDRNKLANNVGFLNFLRKYYEDVKIVYLFTNIAKISGAIENSFLDKLNDYYDVVYAFEPQDAPRYNYQYFPLLYSKNEMDDIVSKEDVFYVGAAKDRYEMLIMVYERLMDLDITSKFYIAGVEQDKAYPEKIIYNQYIPYNQCLRHIQESRCLLDVIQGESEGFTIKVCEAVMYDKLLITTNEKVKEAPFYNPEYILVIEKPEDIKKEFFDLEKVVKYSEEGKNYFSVKRFLKQLAKDLNE